MASSSGSSKNNLASAELVISHVFGERTWQRALCIRGVTTSGADVLVLGDDIHGAFSGGRCEGGRVLATWKAASVADQKTSWKQQEGDRHRPVMSTWAHITGEEFEDPDTIRTAAEYFPVGPTGNGTCSFIRLRLAQSDSCGDEVFIVQPNMASDSVAARMANAVDKETPCSPFMFRPSTFWTFWRTWLTPEAMRVKGVQIVREDAVSPTFGLPAMRDLVASTEAANAGFLPGTPWAQTWRVRCVEEHCRKTYLGLWGWMFGLKHSVLAVYLQRDNGNGHAPSCSKDMLYLDKNADIGVTWRRAGYREYFTEVPRPGYSFTLDVPLCGFWSTVKATKAFREAQERSNCQHFVREVLMELSARGHIVASPGVVNEFTLRNQGIANVLKSFGTLDEDFKGTSTSDVGNWVWQTAMSWGCKIHAAQAFTPWIETFDLQAALMA